MLDILRRLAGRLGMEEESASELPTGIAYSLSVAAGTELLREMGLNRKKFASEEFRPPGFSKHEMDCLRAQIERRLRQEMPAGADMDASLVFLDK